ncbi:MAG TPA: hypothetical protein VGM39_07335 [Kofleriaceae bacterium]|jgi:hypothetical protein
MSEFPSATVENAKPPFHQRAGVRLVLRVVLIAAACFVGWRLFKRFTRPESSKELAVRQDKARKTIGKAFDSLFDDQLDDGSPDVKLETRFKLEDGLDTSYASEGGCAKGFSDAFKEVLGADVVTFEVTGWKDTSNTLSFNGTIAPHGSGFQLANSDKVYKGIMLSGDIKFLGKSVHVDITPPDDIQFDYSTYGFDLYSHGPSEADVAAGILQGSCKEAGLQLLEKMTPWERPPPEEKRDPVKDCEQGFHCRENAEVAEATDKVAASKMYLKACENHDEAACTRAADLAIEAKKPGSELDSMRAIGLQLEMSCHSETVTACAGAGRIAMTSDDDQPVSEYRRKEALVSFVRGCDLGDPNACQLAAIVVPKTPFADAAAILSAEKETVVSKKLGTIFGLHWGQWHKMDNGQATIWTTTKPPSPPKGSYLKSFSGAEIPAAIHPPDGVSTVWAISLDRGTGGDYDQECSECRVNAHSDSPFAMGPFDCICALTPPPAQPSDQ